VRLAPSFSLFALAALAILDPRPAAAAPPGAASSCKVARHRATRRRSVSLSRRIPALRNDLPNIQALGAVIVDLDSGQELFGRNPDRPRAIASISKLAAVMVMMDRQLSLDELTTIKRSDVELARGGAASRLPEGLTLSNRDLLHAALLGSDNRAVIALGRAVGLGATELAEAMTRKAAELGLEHTRFREPTGLSSENVSTPREALAMLRAAMANPVLGPVLRRLEYDARPLGHAPIRYVTTHRPAHRSHSDILGGKTGYNGTARYCLVLAARLEGHNYGMAFLGTEGKLTRFGDAARATDWIGHRKLPIGAGDAVRPPAGPRPEPTLPLATGLEESGGHPAPPDAGSPSAALTPAIVARPAGTTSM
jgi:serine-type D-Ala-D-Ala endopeptidase (penicillin-binding protein 7)